MELNARSTAALGRELVLDELADLTLYRALLPQATGDLRALIETLIPVEEKHFGFWKDFFKIDVATLDWPRRLQLHSLVLFCRIFGASAIGLTIESIELHGIQKYLRAWEAYRDTELGGAIRSILEDEMHHEDSIVSESIARKVQPERVRDIFLGLNDGLVEMLGAVSGFFAAFHTISAVLAAAFTVTVAGAFSMAAGAFMGASSSREIEGVQERKRAFLGEPPLDAEPSRPLASAVSVGVSYFIGALIPIAPVFLGKESLPISIAVSVVAVILVSYLLAFMSGMDVRRRIVLNVLIAGLAVIVTFAFGLAADQLLGWTPR